VSLTRLSVQLHIRVYATYNTLYGKMRSSTAYLRYLKQAVVHPNTWSKQKLFCTCRHGLY